MRGEATWGDRPVLSFRPLRAEDLDLLLSWLSAQPALTWYAHGAAPTPEQIARKYLPRVRAEQPMRCRILLLGETAVGYFQSYRLRDFPDHPAAHLEPSAVGVDFFLGSEWTGRGLGPSAIRAFVRCLLRDEADVDACWADPHPENLRSIRALLRAGFRPRGHGGSEAQPALLLRLSRAAAEGTEEGPRPAAAKSPAKS